MQGIMREGGQPSHAGVPLVRRALILSGTAH